MGVRIDKILMSSLFESFQFYSEESVSVTVSGEIPAGGKEFEAVIPYDREGSIADVYYKKSTSDFKRAVNSLQRVTEWGGATTANAYVRYASDHVRVGIFVSNPGAPYTPTTEQYDFDLKIFDAPFGA